MSFFDIWFTSARYDGTTARRRNPFTGEMIDVPQTVPLAAPQVDAVREALTQAGAIPQDAAGNYRLVTADGARAEIDAKNLSAGCRFAVRGVGVTPQLGKLLFDILVIGEWLLLIGDDADATVVADEAHIQNVPAGGMLGNVVVVTSGDDIVAIAASGFEAWQRYRAQVAGRPGSSG